jgi:hypothetical protein
VGFGSVHISGALRYKNAMDLQRRIERPTPAVPQAMDVTHTYWFAMLAATAFGTNLGNLRAGTLFPGRLTSLASLLVVGSPSSACTSESPSAPRSSSMHAAQEPFDPRPLGR